MTGAVERRRPWGGAPRSADGASASSHRRNAGESTASRHPAMTSRPIARRAPVSVPSGPRKQRPRSRPSKASGSGSSATAPSRMSRFSDWPIASVVVSRLRRRRPSDRREPRAALGRILPVGAEPSRRLLSPRPLDPRSIPIWGGGDPSRKIRLPHRALLRETLLHAALLSVPH